MKSKKVEIGSVFEAKNGSFAKVVTFTSKDTVIVYTYHPVASNDFLYEKELYLSNLVSGSFRSVDTPNKYGGYIGQGIYRTSCKRLNNAWNNTQKYAYRKGRKLKAWSCFQDFAQWYVSHPYHMQSTWQLNYELLQGNESVIDEKTTCMLPREIAHALRVSKPSRIVKKKGLAFIVNRSVCREFGMPYDVIFLREQDVISLYCYEKEKKIKFLALKYKNELPEHVYQTLNAWCCCVDLI